MLKAYYQLTKPGIIYGNALTAAAGFFLASKGHISWRLLLAMLIGLSLVIGASCTLNNVFDADIDAKMDRTKNRAMVSGKIAKTNAVVYGLCLLVFGILILYFYTTIAAMLAALAGVVFYLALYTPLKRLTVHGTLVGAIAGATPPVVGYCAVTNRFDGGAIILFLILVFWQMPHFYAIAIRRLNDYDAAGIPVLPAKKGIRTTKIQMLFYIVAFTVAAAALTFFKYTGYVYLTVAILLGLFWLAKGIKGFKVANDSLWAKKMFLFSLVVLTALCVIISIGNLLA